MDALSGVANESAEDRTFWDALLRGIGFQNIHMKPLGGVRHVIDIADYIIANNIEGNLVIMDRDFPGKKRSFIDRRVLYSYGYAWENDVVVPEVVALSVVNQLHLDHSEISSIELEFSQLFKKMIRLTRWPIFLQLRTSNPKCDFMPTDFTLGGCITSAGPFVRLEGRPLRERVRRNKSRFVASGTRTSTAEAKRYLPGHALMGLAYAVVACRSAVRPALRPTRVGFIAMMLRTFSATPLLYLTPEALMYYRNWVRDVI
jgi:hypothetical protein